MRGGEDRCLFICLLITEVLKGTAVPCWREGDGGGVHKKKKGIYTVFLLNVLFVKFFSKFFMLA